MAPQNVVAHVVTYNHEQTIGTCLEALIKQRGLELGVNYHIWVTDNASTDRSALEARRFVPHLRLKEHRYNIGFTGAHNQAALEAQERGAKYFLVVNPDLRLEPDAVEKMVSVLEADPRAGAVCPKLFRADENLEPVVPRRFDSTGMYITPGFRHFDRGSEEIDTGQYDQPEYVFGASGAAVLFRADFIRDVSLPAATAESGPALFDPLFFAYREDAELFWRAQWLGWKCRYEPTAVGFHKRKVLPQNRSELDPELNAYSVRNRFLMQFNNAWCSPRFLPALWRNMLVRAAVHSREKSSMAALNSADALKSVAARHRRRIRKKRRVRSADLARWFRFEPYSEPALALPPVVGHSLDTISVIVVNYQSGERLRNCLDSLKDSLGGVSPRVSAIVVDNASTDGSAEDARAAYAEEPNVRFFISETNRGFAGAINLAVERCPAEAYLILNPDVRIGRTAIDTLARTLGKYADIAAAAPILIDENGRPQPNYFPRDFPSLASTLTELFGLHRFWPNNPWTARYRRTGDRFFRRYVSGVRGHRGSPSDDISIPYIVPQPAAACLLVRHAAFSAVGGFDASFSPAWFEDVDFCRRLASSKLRCAVVSSARVTHEGGYSYRELGESRFARIWYPNMARYWMKHGGSFARCCMRVALPLALIARGAKAYLTAGHYLLTGKAASGALESGATYVRLAASSFSFGAPTEKNTASGDGKRS